MVRKSLWAVIAVGLMLISVAICNLYLWLRYL